MSEYVESSAAQDPPVKVVRDDADAFLRVLVWLTKSGIEYGITLNVDGVLVSGMLISGKTYFEEFKAEFVNSLNGKDDFEELTRVIDDMLSRSADVHGEADGMTVLPNHVHLRNTRFFQADGSALPARGVLWRGRLSQVSGFTLGQMSVEQ